MSDFVGELLDSRSLADLASRLYRIGDAQRAKLISEKVNRGPSNTALIFFFARCFKTYQAAIELLRLGFPQDAAVLARAIREAAYQAAWIAKNGDETAKLQYLFSEQKELDGCLSLTRRAGIEHVASWAVSGAPPSGQRRAFRI